MRDNDTKMLEEAYTGVINEFDGFKRLANIGKSAMSGGRIGNYIGQLESLIKDIDYINTQFANIVSKNLDNQLVKNFKEIQWNLDHAKDAVNASLYLTKDIHQPVVSKESFNLRNAGRGIDQIKSGIMGIGSAIKSGVQEYRKGNFQTLIKELENRISGIVNDIGRAEHKMGQTREMQMISNSASNLKRAMSYITAISSLLNQTGSYMAAQKPEQAGQARQNQPVPGRNPQNPPTVQNAIRLR